MRRAVRAALVALLGAGMLWGAGFTRFERNAHRAAPDAPSADGIVALTGGADRIDTALRLLEDGRAPLLLISGVGRGSDLPEIARRAQLDPAVLGQKITLGRVATTTQGNAEETAAWARAHQIHSLLVVTAGYHMPRALLEIGQRIPDATLHPVPVRPPAMRGGADLAAVRLLANEYDKLLAVGSGLTRLRRDVSP